jgi:hypothetical protein
MIYMTTVRTASGPRILPNDIWGDVPSTCSAGDSSLGGTRKATVFAQTACRAQAVAERAWSDWIFVYASFRADSLPNASPVSFSAEPANIFSRAGGVGLRVCEDGVAGMAEAFLGAVCGLGGVRCATFC